MRPAIPPAAAPEPNPAPGPPRTGPRGRNVGPRLNEVQVFFFLRTSLKEKSVTYTAYRFTAA